MDASEQRPIVSTYYGRTLKTSSDLKTSACCPIDAVPAAHRRILSSLHPDVTTRFYGCGSPIPDRLAGQTILDLGCGTGRDAFLAAALAGPQGRVIGVDMTEEQLRVARDTQQFHADLFFGLGATPTTDFRHGFIEDLRSANVDDASVDVVISNCVCNLSTDKRAVFAEVARVLKQGGEFYFSDVYADRRLSDQAQRHPTLVAECLGGALYLEDFRRLMAQVGFSDVRVVTSGAVDVHDPELGSLVPGVRFASVTVRAFKIDALEDRREDCAQLATFQACCGGAFKLDVDFEFPSNKPVPVDANTAAILQHSRFKSQFAVSPPQAHRGLMFPAVEAGSLSGRVFSQAHGQDQATTSSTKPAAACCSPPAASAGKGGSCCAPAEPAATGDKATCCAPAAAAEPSQAKPTAPCCAPAPAPASVSASAAAATATPAKTDKEALVSETGCRPAATRGTNGCCTPTDVVSEAEAQGGGCRQGSGCC